MTGASIRGVLAGAVILLAGRATAADDPVLPAPRSVPTPAPRLVPTPIVWPLGFERPDPYAVWQNYAVDRQGRWRPRVSTSYGVPHYLATGEYYPWMAEHPLAVRPQVSSAATFAGPPEPPLVIVMPAPVRGWERMPYADE
jgi:hypothetical protein